MHPLVIGGLFVVAIGLAVWALFQSYASVGTKGPTGDKGITGDQGPSGNKGLTGASGPGSSSLQCSAKNQTNVNSSTETIITKNFTYGGMTWTEKPAAIRMYHIHGFFTNLMSSAAICTLRVKRGSATIFTWLVNIPPTNQQETSFFNAQITQQNGTSQDSSFAAFMSTGKVDQAQTFIANAINIFDGNSADYNITMQGNAQFGSSLYVSCLTFYVTNVYDPI